MDMHKTIALVPIAAKPYHAGHDALIRIASSENDEVRLFVSTGDRKRSDELSVLGSTMQKIWIDFIEPTLPANVTIHYGPTPVRTMFEELEEADAGASQAVYKIYSDIDDIKKYSDNVLMKSAPILFSNGQVLRRGIKRTETVNVSGTKMRELLNLGNVAEFTSLLPSSIQKHGEEIFNLLVNDIVNESVLRKYVRISLKFLL